MHKTLLPLLTHIQHVFRSVYGYETPDVREYLVDIRTLRNAAVESRDDHLLPELEDKSFVGWQAHPGSLDQDAYLYVYFCPRDILAIDNALPTIRQSAGRHWLIDEINVDIFLQVAACVANFQHYVYLLSKEMPLSLFHISLQNQVDQFVFIHSLFASRERCFSVPELLSNRVLYPGLDRGDRQLSREPERRSAQQHAYRFMRHIYRRFIWNSDYPGFSRAVKDFFYKPQSGKVSEINALY